MHWLSGHLRDPLRRNSYLLIVNNLVTTGFGFVGWLIAAQAVSAKEFGESATLVSSALLLIALSKLGLDTVLLRHLFSERYDPRLLLKWCFGIAAAAAASLGLAFSLLASRLWPASVGSLASLEITAAFVALCVAATAGLLLDYVLLAAQRPEQIIIRSSVFGASKIVLFLVALPLGGVPAIILGWGMASLGALVLGLWMARRVELPKRHETSESWRPLLGGLWRFSLATYGVGLASVALGYIFPLLIAVRGSPEDAGRFYVAWMFAATLAVIPWSVGQSLLSSARTKGFLLQAALWRALRHAYIVTAAGTAVLLLMGGIALRAFGKASPPDSMVLNLLTLGMLAGVGNVVYTAASTYEGKSLRMIAFPFLVAVGTIAGTWLLLPSMGLVGVGLSFLTSQALATALALMDWRMRDLLNRDAPPAEGGSA